jgi:hypothetical protein
MLVLARAAAAYLYKVFNELKEIVERRRQARVEIAEIAPREETAAAAAAAAGEGHARGCIVCGGSGHSHRACVVLGAALHRKLDAKDDLVEVILRLLLWRDWGVARFDRGVACLSYGPGDVIAIGHEGGSLHLICAGTGQKIRSMVKGRSR